LLKDVLIKVHYSEGKKELYPFAGIKTFQNR